MGKLKIGLILWVLGIAIPLTLQVFLHLEAIYCISIAGLLIFKGLCLMFKGMREYI